MAPPYLLLLSPPEPIFLFISLFLYIYIKYIFFCAFFYSCCCCTSFAGAPLSLYWEVLSIQSTLFGFVCKVLQYKFFFLYIWHWRRYTIRLEWEVKDRASEWWNDQAHINLWLKEIKYRHRAFMCRYCVCVWGMYYVQECLW